MFLSNEKQTKVRHSNLALREIITGMEMRFSCHLDVKHYSLRGSPSMSAPGARPLLENPYSLFAGPC